jgi:nucleotide-binding universal stress UspA family protein
MTIVCGTDFSEHSRKAIQAAARLASRMNMPLHLVHAIDLGAAELAGELTRGENSRAAARLLVEKERLASLAIDVQIHAPEGAPDEVLLNVATHVHAKLIVVAALGQRPPGKWQLGSHADRLAQMSHVPVLVIRDAGGFEDWVAGRRALRVLMGVDFSLASEHAMRWVGALCAFGPCEISALHLYWPPDQFERLGLSGVRDYMGPHPEVVQAVQAQFARRFVETIGLQPVRMMVQPHIGRPADRIAKQAEEDEVDLVVVGSHSRDPIERMIEGSVSGGVLYSARVSVACVPAPRDPLIEWPARIRNVLVATDFTNTGNAAVALAYSLVAPHGKVHIAHVVPERQHGAVEARDIFVSADEARTSEPHASAWRRLAELRLPGYSGQAESLVHVLESNEPAVAIAQAAERLDVGLICLGTHGRGGVARAALGSVAQDVLHHTERPVLFARARKT